MSWEIISKQTLQADRFSIEIEQVKKDEAVTLNYSYVTINHGVCILAVTDEQEIICIRQYRQPYRSTLWELPAGAIDGEETAIEAAKRELLEEAGAHAEHWTSLGYFYPSPGSTSEVIHLFLAEGLTISKQQLEASEQIDCEIVSKRQFEQLIKHNEFLHGAGLAAYAKYKVL